MKRNVQDLTRNKAERELHRLGVPHEHWKILLKDLSFKTTPFEGGKLSPDGQRQWCRKLYKAPPYRGLIVATSTPTDSGAMKLASWLTRHQWERHRSTLFMNATDSIDLVSKRFVVIHNVLKNTSDERRQAIRDVALRYSYSLCMIVVAGVTTPESWCKNQLGLTPTSVFSLKDV